MQVQAQLPKDSDASLEAATVPELTYVDGVDTVSLLWKDENLYAFIYSNVYFISHLGIHVCVITVFTYLSTVGKASAFNICMFGFYILLVYDLYDIKGRKNPPSLPVFKKT